MVLPVAEMEFERIMNMLRPFDWTLMEKKVDNGKLELVVKRSFVPKEKPLMETILARARNPLRMMGWEITEESTAEDFLRLKAVKDLGVEIKAAAGIP